MKDIDFRPKAFSSSPSRTALVASTKPPAAISAASATVGQTGWTVVDFALEPDVTGVADLPEGTEMVMPGDNVNLNVELITPVAMESGSRFAIREGGRTVGAGVITKVQE